MLFASAVVVAVPFALSDVVMVTTGLQNSGSSGQDTEEEINRRTQVTAQVVISGEAGQTIILSPDLFALTFSEETEPAAIHYTVTSSSAAMTVRYQDSTAPLSTFSHQDLLDGAVVVTITDPSVLVDLNLTVRHDAGGDFLRLHCGQGGCCLNQCLRKDVQSHVPHPCRWTNFQYSAKWRAGHQ